MGELSTFVAACHQPNTGKKGFLFFEFNLLSCNYHVKREKAAQVRKWE